MDRGRKGGKIGRNVERTRREYTDRKEDRERVNIEMDAEQVGHGVGEKGMKKCRGWTYRWEKERAWRRAK